MNQQHENSLLFSLAELRAIEDSRIAEEAQAARDAEAESQRAAQAARERKEAQMAALKRAELERVERSAQLERDRLRHEQLALEETERLARVAADERLARERLALEISLAPRPQNKRWPIAVAIAASIAGLALSALYVRTAGALTEIKQAHAGLASDLEEANAKEREATAALADQRQTISELRKALAASDARRPAAASTQPTPSTSRPSRPGKPTRPTRPTKPVEPVEPPIRLPTCRDSKDPLCGLGPSR